MTSLVTSDGLRLAARRWDPPTPSPSGVVLVHGFTAGKDHEMVVATAEGLTAAGHHVLSYDARGHGPSEGLCTLGDAEELDVAAAVHELRGTVDQIVLVGASMGAVAVLRYAAGRTGLAGVVSVSGPAHWRFPRTPPSAMAALLTQTRLGRIALRRLTGVRTAGKFTRPSPPAELVARVEVPVAVIHGHDDRFLTRREAHALFSAAGDRCRLELVQGMGHAFGTEAVPAIVAAVEWTLLQGATHR